MKWVIITRRPKHVEAIHSRVLKTSKDISWFFFGGGGVEVSTVRHIDSKSVTCFKTSLTDYFEWALAYYKETSLIVNLFFIFFSIKIFHVIYTYIYIPIFHIHTPILKKNVAIWKYALNINIFCFLIKKVMNDACIFHIKGTISFLSFESYCAY